MSIRSHTNRANHFSSASAPSNAIDFRDDFVNSTAVYAASTDETVSQIMQRLDQLHSKIANGEQTTTPQAKPARVAATGDLNSRVSTLESIHEDTLHRMGTKLDVVERKLGEHREMESLMGQISSKFSKIESQLSASKESEGLINKVADKFSLVESRLQSASQLSDRVEHLESRMGLHSDLHSRIAKLESRLDPRSDLHSRITKLESNMEPNPEQERLISRITAKLDKLERQPSEKEGAFLGAEHNDRIDYLQNRIEKLKELRTRYENEEGG